MRSVALVGLLLSFTTIEAGAGSLNKPYFGATPPGAWAKTESSWEQPGGMAGTSRYTYIRVPDDAGRVRIEVDTEVVTGPGEGMVTRQLFVMEPGFDMAMNCPNRMMYMEGNVTLTGDGPPIVGQDAVIKIMRQAGMDLVNSVTFKGEARVQGRTCDHYAYSAKTGGAYATVNEGEIWLDATVPFGIVLQKGKVTDTAGKLLSTFEEKLVDSGTGNKGTAALLAATPAPKAAAPADAGPEPVQALSLLDAYKGGRIRLLVEVKPGSGGKHLTLKAVNKTKAPIDVIVPAGAVTLAADTPLTELKLVSEKEQRISVSAGGTSAPFAAQQAGKRGAIEGKFQLTTHDGNPLFMGNIKVGSL
jgi:hypothetical protein